MANWVADFLERNPDLAARPIAQRAKHAIHFDLGGRDRIAKFTGASSHYLDNDIYKPIDTKLLIASGGFYGAPHSDVQVHPDGRVQVAGTNYQQLTDLPGSPTGSLDNDRIVREFSGGRQYLYMKEDGFKQEIILDHIPGLTVSNAGKLLAAVSGSLPLKYYASVLTATDAAKKTYRYTTTAELIAWLQAATYPVIIDPDFAAADIGIYDGICGESGTSYSAARGTGDRFLEEAWVGQYRFGGASGDWEIYRLVHKFDTSSIPDASTINQVNLTMVCVDDSSGVNFDVVISKSNWSSHDPIASYSTDLSFDDVLAGTKDVTWRNTSGMSENTQYASPNMDTSWISKTAYTYYGLISQEDINNSEPATDADESIRLGEHNHATTSYRPFLTVLYSTTGNPYYAYSQQ